MKSNGIYGFVKSESKQLNPPCAPQSLRGVPRAERSQQQAATGRDAESVELVYKVMPNLLYTSSLE